jgi:hypothetical protein
MHTRLTVLAFLALGFSALTLVATPPTSAALDCSAGTTDLLPDLRAFPASDLAIARKGKSQRLRFTTMSGNYGPGPLVLRGGEIVNGKSKQRVYQRVYKRPCYDPNDTNYTESLVGEFVYHPQHRHFHLENYARYELIPDSGDASLRRTSTKTSFCIQNTLQIPGFTDGDPNQGSFLACNGMLQGMSRGWADKYGASLAGQEIDITGIPPGNYRLVISVNPEQRVHEADSGPNLPANNVSSVHVHLENGVITILS